MPESLLRVLACGSVDDGKSTLIGRLLFECGTIPDDVMAALERDSIRFGTVEGGTDYALLVDGLAAERDQGITIDVVPLYFAAQRPTVIRDGALIVVDDDRMRLNPGETPTNRLVRFRSLGCYPLSAAVLSDAADMDALLAEMRTTRDSERSGRLIDQDEDASMERKKREGYF